jgi:hypothetical protein
MDFQIWKVKHGIGSTRPWFTYSIRRGVERIVVLNQDQFSALFPEIDLAAVPAAPFTGTLGIQVELK